MHECEHDIAILTLTLHLRLRSNIVSFKKFNEQPDLEDILPKLRDQTKRSTRFAILLFEIVKNDT